MKGRGWMKATCWHHTPSHGGKQSVDCQEKCSRQIFNSSKNPWCFNKWQIFPEECSKHRSDLIFLHFDFFLSLPSTCGKDLSAPSPLLPRMCHQHDQLSAKRHIKHVQLQTCFQHQQGWKVVRRRGEERKKMERQREERGSKGKEKG